MSQLATESERDNGLGELEALLFAASRPLSAASIARRLALDQAQAEELIRMLADQLHQPSRGLQLHEASSGWRLETKPQHSDVLAAERAARREKPLTAQALEALAVIALAQPVSSQEVSRTRGAESYTAIETLRRHGLIAPTESRRASRKATLWRTTQRFLDRLGFRSLNELAHSGAQQTLLTDPTVARRLIAQPASLPDDREYISE